MFIFRTAILILTTLLGLYTGYDFVRGATGVYAGLAAGFIVGIFVIVIERKLVKQSAHAILGGIIGLLSSLVTLNLIFLGISIGSSREHLITAPVRVVLSLVFAYFGLILGSQKAEGIFNIFSRKSQLLSRMDQSVKLLDTSVIIDGRIADICETSFIEGQLIIPQFVLRELQHIADSSDSLKRNRGRRGLDILQKIQRNADLNIQIVDNDFPKIKDVDSKLVALAKLMNGKVITNDFNLNKVAELQGVTVLNINQLANALKPVVLPGEIMKVYVLKEGKEQGQGVAYLDDGTMVVVDNAKKMLGKTVEVSVTSVLQTTAGRMIFTRLKSDVERNNDLSGI